ncbi:hypothetical protein GCK72_009447 [Caenorhabditis remanei]|uniref:Uncharacterized protein n=1 Tax=Caenorhabditis remanei TaxID=31234 RepID=A0A6A5H3V0_CAERE|nr:hypothetical protein GCK72_009447 [Caenorhabditis remanei]KAF1761193.1 hypothetical protein GCK72_009447 [Caenorhabditis remanei]
MNGDRSRSTMICQKEVWKTCVICGDLNKQILMRSITEASHLHVIVAYLKFSGSIDHTRNFSTYDKYKTYECYVCLDHIDAPAKALRKVYSFPLSTTQTSEKCNLKGLLAVLKQYMPPEYNKMTEKELDEAIPNFSVPITKTAQKVDCSCCRILTKTRDRLKTVLENAEDTPTCIRLNFAVFQELTEIENQLDLVSGQNEGVKAVSESLAVSLRQEAHENYLLGFEKQRMSQLNANFLKPVEQNHKKPTFEIVPFVPPKPRRRILKILPTHPGVPYSQNSHPHLLRNPIYTGKSNKNSNILMENWEPPCRSIDRKRKNPLSPILTQLSTTNGTYLKENPTHFQFFDSPNIRLEPFVNFAQGLHSPPPFNDQNTYECAKEILNSKLIVFSFRTLIAWFPEKDVNIIQGALMNLEKSGIIHYLSQPDDTIFIKEIRREYLKNLWNYGIIPEHFRQRLLSQNTSDIVRMQFEKHKKSLLTLNSKPNVSELISDILSATDNSELEIEFGKFNSEVNSSFSNNTLPSETY